MCGAVQVLPFASEETLVALERNLAELGPVSQLLQEGLTPREIASRLLGDLEAPEDQGFSLNPRRAPPPHRPRNVSNNQRLCECVTTNLCDGTPSLICYWKSVYLRLPSAAGTHDLLTSPPSHLCELVLAKGKCGSDGGAAVLTTGTGRASRKTWRGG